MSDTTLQTQTSSTTAAIDFIKLLYEPGDLICFAFQSADTWKQAFRTFEDAIKPETMALIQKANDSDHNIYVAMNVYRGPGRTEGNIAAVRNVWAEIDSNGRENLEKVFASKLVPDPTIVNESSPGKFHVIWKVKDATVEESKILLKAICAEFNSDPNATDAARVLRVPGFRNNKYPEKPEVGVVHLSENTSRHSLSEFSLLAKTAETTPKTKPVLTSDEPIPYGQHDSTLFAIACALREKGLTYEEMLPVVMRHAERCIGRGGDWVDMVEKKCHSAVDRYAAGDPGPTVTIGGKLPGEAVISSAQNGQKTRDLIVDDGQAFSRPVFPYHVMEGTTLYEGLVKPVVENSSKHAEFVFMPAVQMMLNYLSGKVRIAMQDVNLNLYIGLVSPPGQFFKSSSCALSHDYFKSINLSTKYIKSLSSADGRVIVMQTGSAEGFGLTMAEICSKNAILFNDELGKLVSKAGIENSSLPYDLLTWYESGDFGNTVKSRRDTFSFEAKSYTFGWQWCTTTRGFNKHWPKIAGVVSGLEDRMFFVVSPEKPRSAATYRTPPMEEASKKTLAAMEAAILKSVYQFSSMDEVTSLVTGMNPRTMQMLFALALYFAVDLKRDSIDDDCLKRAKALVQFRDQATAFLAPIEAENEQGRMQQEITRELRQNKGKMKYRDLFKDLHGERFGSDRWKAGYKGLIGEGIIAEFNEKTKAGQTAKMVALLVLDD